MNKQTAAAAAAASAAVRWDSLAKLPGSLGLLEDAVVRLAGIQGTADPRIDDKRVWVFCADNGVWAEDVSPSPQAVTAQQAVNFARGGGAINAFARRCGATVTAVDVGIATPYEEPAVKNCRIRKGTGNIAKEPAMTREECAQAIALGKRLAGEGGDLLIPGDMGIGNTTTASAVTAVLLGLPPAAVAARGAAGDPVHKIEVIERALALHKPDAADSMDVLCKVGGLDIAALCGMFLGARQAVMIDGFISGAAALCAAQIDPGCKEYMIASHCTAEAAGGLQLKALGLKPLITANMCLGEGTGGALAAVLLDCALGAYREIITLEEMAATEGERSLE